MKTTVITVRFSDGDTTMLDQLVDYERELQRRRHASGTATRASVLRQLVRNCWEVVRPPVQHAKPLISEEEADALRQQGGNALFREMRKRIRARNPDR